MPVGISPVCRWIGIFTPSLFGCVAIVCPPPSVISQPLEINFFFNSFAVIVSPHNIIIHVILRIVNSIYVKIRIIFNKKGVVKIFKKNEKHRAKKLQKEAKSLNANKKNNRTASEEEGLYKIKRTTGMYVARAIFWAMLAFVFIRGVVTIFRPDPREDVNTAIATFKAEAVRHEQEYDRITAFAQDFAYYYLSYEDGKEEEYINNLNRYIINGLATFPKVASGAKAEVLYINAYKKEKYSENSFDVWVVAKVEYTGRTVIKQEDEDTEIISDTTRTKEIILQIPIDMVEEKLIVTGLPIYITDNSKIDNYKEPTIKLSAVDTKTTEQIKISLNDFYSVYYGGKQSTIEYYLDAAAERKDFQAITTVEYSSINEIHAYYLNDVSDSSYIVETTIKVVDESGTELLQTHTFLINKKDSRFYILKMGTKAQNLI